APGGGAPGGGPGGGSGGGTSGPSDGGDDAGRSDSGVPDAGGSDGGTPDAGPSDAGPRDAGASDAGPCNGALLCETFESWPQGAVTGPQRGWTPRQTHASLQVAPGPGDGGLALRVDLPGQADSDGTIALPLTGLFPTKGYHLFARVWLYGEQLPSTATYARHGFVSVEGTNPGTTDSAHVATRHDQGRQPYFNYFVNPPFIDCACCATPTPPLPVQEWVCYELELDDATSSAKLYFDGGATPVTQMSMKGTFCGDGNTQRVWAFPTLGSLRLGIYAFDAAPLRVWLDDVAVSSTRVGCAR
ncbi:MAG: hypothetical protein K1X89_28140, partial [Myxococcaceae bacterium]|nr:hypothetical protein [Myxococcaceae bacterium]